MLLIDDDEDDQEFFLSVLDAMDEAINCETAKNGLVALEQLSQSSYRPHLIFLDLNMPVMNGREFLQEVKRIDALKDIPVIVLSTSSNERAISDMKDLGAVEFITKPNKLSILEVRLKAVFENESYFQHQ